MRACVQCSRPVEDSFRFCPWCATPQRLKLTDHFPGEGGRALRVSRYLAPEDCEPHVRISIWSPEGVAEAAVSLDEDEAERLAGFIAASALLPAARRRRLAGLVDRLVTR
jgi:hypothetical protein